jgi:hypothetical protein
MIGKTTLLMLGLMAAVPAAAQQNTECSTDYFGSTRCQTTGSPSSGGINWGILNQQRPVDAGEAFRRGYEDAQRRRQEAEMHRQQMLLVQQQRSLAEAQQGQIITPNEREAQTYSPNLEVIADAENEALRKRTGDLVAAGECEQAEKLAVLMGRFEMASSIKAYCAK